MMKNKFCLLAHELTENGRISSFCLPVIMMMHYCLLLSTHHFTAAFILPIKLIPQKLLERLHPLLIFGSFFLCDFFFLSVISLYFLLVNKNPVKSEGQKQQGTRRTVIQNHVEYTGTSVESKWVKIRTLRFILLLIKTK